MEMINSTNPSPQFLAEKQAPEVYPLVDERENSLIFLKLDILNQPGRSGRKGEGDEDAKQWISGQLVEQDKTGQQNYCLLFSEGKKYYQLTHQCCHSHTNSITKLRQINYSSIHSTLNLTIS